MLRTPNDRSRPGLDTSEPIARVGILRRVYYWVLRWAATPFAPVALALLAVCEAFFLPVPTETLLIPMALGRRRRAIRYGILAACCSVTGGVIGYAIGRWIGDPLLQWVLSLPVLSWLHMTEKYEAVKAAFAAKSSFYIFVAALTPVPYMVVTNAAGVCHDNVPFVFFVLASVVGRGLRFGSIGLLFYLFGGRIRPFIEKYFDLLTVAFIVLLVLVFACVKIFSGEASPPEGQPPVAPLTPDPQPAATDFDQSQGSPMISPEGQRELLRIARQTVEAAVNRRRPPQFEVSNPELMGHQGAFVTLKTQDQLRGCIGRFIAQEPLWQVVRDMAAASATQDARFFGMQLRPEELGDLDIEISVLSPLEQVSEPLAELEIGTHGIYIKRGGRSGCFLPQVAAETGWTMEEFLSNCCRGKAGLSPDAWRDPSTEVYAFTAQIISDPPSTEAS